MKTRISAAILAALASAVVVAQETRPAGPLPDGGHLLSTSQLIRPAGKSIEFAGRPVDLALSADAKTLVAKDNRGLVVVDAESWQLKQELKFPEGGGSMTGVAITRDGRLVFATDANNQLHEAKFGEDGQLAWTRAIKLPGPQGKGKSFPCGVALSADDRTAYVCLSRNNALAIVDLAEGRVSAEVPVGIAPYAVRLSRDGRQAYVSNWGGRRPNAGESTADSAGTKAAIDARGVAASGTVSIVDLGERKSKAEIEVGLSPCGLELNDAGDVLYVANANSDSVSIIDLDKSQVLAAQIVRPDEKLPFGSMPNGLVRIGDQLFVSLAGNNAIAVLRMGADGRSCAGVAGLIPTGWYPGNMTARGAQLFIANIKGVGSRSKREDKAGWNSHWHRGSLTCVEIPGESELAKLTQQAREDARVPQALKAREMQERRADAKPLPVPQRIGEPSVFEHVVYVVKENRTYDQMFGDLPRGNRDESLCTFGRNISPNHHALAEQFVQLDNYYCNGVLSADGHSWVTEGNVTPYLERSFGGFNRSYTFGDDPLTFSSSGFIWDHVLAAGFSFRNYGEFDQAAVEPTGDYASIYKDWQEKGGKYGRKQKISLENLRRFTCPDYPGWNMNIPDVLRAEVFLKELREFEQNGQWPNFVMIYLPNDHTSGTAEGHPTPASLVADNDLALGRIVEAISHSRYWASTCIFVVEDDPQNGYDHVDGHRSICLAISPYAKRGALVSEFYNQTSVYHTIERIFGVTPYNQNYALAPLMSACFSETPDLKPYDCLPNNVPLAQMNKKAALLPPRERELARASAAMDLTKPDRADEDTLNRILWHAAKGVDAPYPSELAGAHGRGLKALGLKLSETTDGLEPDDDD